MEDLLLLDDVSVMMLLLMAVAGALAVLAFAFSLNVDTKRKYAAGVIMLIIYILYVTFTGFVYISFNYDSFILYGSVVVITLVGTGYVFFRCIKEKNSMNWMTLLLFLVYMAIVIAVTILTRHGTVTRTVNMIPFDHVRTAIETGETHFVDGDILNVILFIPFGYLIRQINKQVFHKFVYVLIIGFAASTLIESIQLIFHLGQCDINDIIMNTLGAVIGYWISLFNRPGYTDPAITPEE